MSAPAVGIEITTPMGAAVERLRALGGKTMSVDDGHELDVAVSLCGLAGTGDWWAFASRYDPTTGTQVMREAVCAAPIDALKAATQIDERLPWMDQLAAEAGAL